MINVGIIGCGFVGGALKDWLEHNNPECKLFISDPPKGYNDDLSKIDIEIKNGKVIFDVVPEEEYIMKCE